MIRDTGPRYTLGFGVSSDQVTDSEETEGVNPESGVIAKALHGHPVMRFLAVSAVTMVGMHIAGAQMRRGGTKLLKSLAEGSARGKEWQTRLLTDFRKTQEYLDTWQGLHRKRGTLSVGDELFDDPTGDEVTRLKGFFFTREERAKAAALGVESDAQWTIRDELRQRLVSQGRRLPYELPAAYLTQRAFTDPLFGENQKGRPNWANPIDVIGDFAQQSVKNVATMILPFEAGAAGVKQGWRRFMLYGDDEVMRTGTQRAIRDVSVGLQSSLKLIGHDASELLFKASTLSQRTTGAMSAGLQESLKQRKSVGQQLNETRNIWARMKSGGASPTGDEAMGLLPGVFGGVRPFKQGFKKGWREIGKELDANRGVRGTTAIEKMAEDIDRLVGEGEFSLAHGMRMDEYKNILVNNLVDQHGVSREAARRFAHLADITLPKLNARGGVPRRDAVNAVGFGRDWFEGKDFQEALSKRLTSARIDQADVITQNIDNAIALSDRYYLSSTSRINRQIKTRSSRAYQWMIETADEGLGQAKLPYGAFGQIPTGQVNDFLVRRTAKKLGVSLSGKTGSEIRAAIQTRGIDPSDIYQMRGFLVEHGVISKPWNAQGFNLLGLKPLTLEEAGQDAWRQNIPDNVAARIKKTVEDLGKVDTISPEFRRTPIRGAYQTSTGKILDLNPLTSGFRKAFSVVANELQIPFIHIKPLNLFGANIFEKMANRPSIQFASGFSNPHLKGGENPLLWMRTRGTKGKLARILDDEVETIPGTFRSFAGDTLDIAGRNLRFGLGDRGLGPSEGRRSRFSRLFAVDEHQPDSIFNWAKRFHRRNVDPLNPRVAAQQIRSGEINRLAQEDPAQAAKAINNLIKEVRRIAGFSPRVARAIDEDDAFRGILKVPGQDDVVLSEVHDPTRMMGILRRLNDSEDDFIDSLPKEQQRIMRSVRKNLIQRGETRAEMGMGADQAPFSNTIHRRLDEVRADLYQYLLIRRGVTKAGYSLNQEFSDIMSHLQSMQKAGQISGRELTEARAALLGTQLNFRGLTLGGRTTRQQRLIAQAASASESGFATSEVLDDFARGDNARYGPIGGFVKGKAGAAGYDYPGTEYNPFGSNNVFVPTFGSVFARDPFGAVKSALGFTTWSAPEAFSGSSIPVSHGFQRLNRYFGNFGMALDESRFSGPLDLFGRGMVGMRALPLVAGATTAIALDRTLGGAVYDRDEYGNKVYAPLFLGGAARGLAEGQVIAAGLVPGGQTAEEKRHEIFEGEVPVRRGRWWPLGNTPWKGGNEQYFRPSWYRRLMSGAGYGPEGWGSPMERLAFGYDFSPLRPLDPYRWEREHQNTRPYPVTGDYFTGPWGPVTGALNTTIGRVLKPRKFMHQEEVAFNLSNYQTVGAFGAAPIAGDVGVGGASGTGGGGSETSSEVDAFYGAASGSSNSASNITRGSLGRVNSMYSAASALGGPKNPSGMVTNAPVLNPGGLRVQGGQLGYELQELMGIYGFGFGALRTGLGFGNQDYLPGAPVLGSASEGYGSGRSFWDLNLGGLGDMPTPLEGDFANLEISEVIRRFIPRPRRVDMVNPIANDLGRMHPWLPGSDYYTNFKQGDPFALIPEGELRLPGQSYDRLHKLHPDETGKYGWADRFAILGDVAPWSTQYKRMERQAASMDLNAAEQQLVESTIQQANAVRTRHDFSPYEYKYSSASEAGQNPISFYARRFGEWAAHRDTYLNKKFLPERSAVEDWERNNVYGATFPQWQHPIRDFLAPMTYRATTRNPFVSALAMGTVGGLFGATPRAKQVGMMLGGAFGFAAGLFKGAEEEVLGERFIPARRKQELAVEEYTDILSYVKYRRLYEQAKMAGDGQAAQAFQKRVQSTMYGADLYAAPEDLMWAIPKRKREHFRAMIEAPPEERGRILSTAGRLERRIYEAAWGMKVERRPDLGQYFSQHELPGPTWEGWAPGVDMENVKLKMIQQQGLDASQMGYYPQQVKQANLANVSYPDFRRKQGASDAHSQLQQLLYQSGISGSVTKSITPYSGTRLMLTAGVY
ncbi:MAG TPA: hypothetical protein VJ742_12205 [Nitrososphaera sp.]|nr:hypothetical protein [Nitrososphaera sp.]